MSAIQEQSKKLKINATNIKSVLVNKRKVLHNKRKIKSRIVDVNLKQQKQALAAKKAGGGGSGGGGTGVPVLDIMGMGLKFISGVFKFIGLLITGVIINNLPGIVNIAKTAWKAVKPIVNLVWKIVKVVGRTMAAFGKFIVNLFNLGEAEENIKNTEKNNAELEEVSGELLSLPFLDEDLSGEEDDDEGDDDEPEDTEQTTDKAEVKPAATSTTPPSASKGDELSKDGTGDKLTKEKPLPKEETKAKKDQKKQEEKPKEQWTLVDVNEKGFVYKNAAGETKTVIPKNEGGRRAHQRLLKKKNTKYVINDKSVSSQQAERQTTQALIELIESGRLKYFKDGKDVTPVLKTIDIKSLGTEEQVDQLTGKQTVTTIIMPMKETKVKKVPVNNGGGGGTIGGSSNPSKANSNLNTAVI